MGSQWHAVCSEYQAQTGGRVVEMKAESYAENFHCQREKETEKAGETGVDQIKSGLCKRGLISPRTHTHTWSWWSHAPNT